VVSTTRLRDGDREFVAVFDGTTGAVVIIFDETLSYSTYFDDSGRRFAGSPPWLPDSARSELERRLRGLGWVSPV
jgi:hypothetical protein